MYIKLKKISVAVLVALTMGPYAYGLTFAQSLQNGTGNVVCPSATETLYGNNNTCDNTTGGSIGAAGVVGNGNTYGLGYSYTFGDNNYNSQSVVIGDYNQATNGGVAIGFGDPANPGFYGANSTGGIAILSGPTPVAIGSVAIGNSGGGYFEAVEGTLSERSNYTTINGGSVRAGFDLTVQNSIITNPVTGNPTLWQQYSFALPTRISGILPGVNPDDAVNVQQLDNAIAGVTSGSNPLAVNYDDATKASVTFAGTNGTILRNVANGVLGTDAMNLSQGSALATALGGGAAYINGNFQAPAYTFLSGVTYNNVGAALANLDGRVTTLENTPAGTGTVGPAGPQGPVGPQGPQGVAGQNGKDGTNGSGNGTDANAVHYVSGASGDVSINGGGQIHNVNAGTATTDAANVGQVQSAQQAAQNYADTVGAQTLSSANAYTNTAVSGFQTQLNNQQGQIDDLYGKIGDLKDRINSVGAASMAASSLVPLTNQPGTTQLSAGYGNYGGQSALAVGAFHITESGNAIYNLKIAGGTGGGGVGVSVGATYVIKNFGF
ncbi:MAG TPA: YadA-like family protein [Anaerovoracaceae bacterium]|nr:YadA-like family protein [Anaerovoracaceae bacterium]